VRRGFLVGLFALGALTSAPSAAPPATTTLAVAGRANANVSLAASGLFVAAVWSGSMPDGVTDIFGSASRDGRGDVRRAGPGQFDTWRRARQR